MKKLFLMGLMLVSILALAVSAVPATIDEVELDNDEISKTSTNKVRSLDKGDSFQVKVHLTANADVDDVQVEAFMRGHDFDDLIEDVSDVFDMQNGSTYVKKLDLKFPERMDRDRYTLRVVVAGRSGPAAQETYEIEVETKRHDVVIKDVIPSPQRVKSGRALLASVRAKNQGQAVEDDVKVTVSVPELGISASDYIDELEEDGDRDDSVTSEELFLRIPQCAQAGFYDLVATVEYHDLTKRSQETIQIEVLEDPACEGVDKGMPVMKKGKTVISVGPDSQDVAKGGAGAVYPLTITNAGQASMTYTVSVTGGDWGSFRVSPSNVVTVGTDNTKTVYVYATANDAAVAGPQSFSVTVSSGDRDLTTQSLNANVVEGAAGTSLKRVLEIGLVVLVVILVILGLIIGFNKLKGDDEDKEEGQSYY